MMQKRARHYIAENERIRCELCPHRCLIQPGRTGLCRARLNQNGTLYATNYGACTAVALDPIEKKPLYHFYPGADILSLGSWGCNFTCQFCQNWHIAQSNPKVSPISPEQAVELAVNAGKNNIGIAYTYSEPSVWFEFVYDTAVAAKRAGLQNVLVTNGFLNQQPLWELLPYIDAMNIDVKAFTEDFYRTICSGTLHDVKQTVELAVQHCHVEIATLVVPGLNDSAAEIQALAGWLSSLSPDIPLHLSRYFPNYQMQLPPTGLDVLNAAWQTAKERLHYVYMGNVEGQAVTACPHCGAQVIDRRSHTSSLVHTNHCPVCGQEILLVGEIRFS